MAESDRFDEHTLREADPGPNLYNIMGQRISTAGARKRFASLVNRAAQGERIKITRYNKTAGVLIPKSDLEALEECEKTEAQKNAADEDRVEHRDSAAKLAGTPR